MELLPKILFLCLALALTNGAPMPPDDAAVDDAALPDRCEGIEFDAVTPDEKGNIFYFKGSHLWNGFHGAAQLSNESFKELDDIHHIGHVDAAFRMHNADNPGDHDHIYFFLDDKVFSYYNHTLEDGYPKEIQEDFPGIPSHLDSAVECPKGECMDDSVLFFKGQDLHVYDINTKTVKNKTWPHLPVCTSALRWLEHHYCFHGHNFTVFNPVTGVVTGPYPKDIRNYFMKCEGFGHGGDRKAQKCSEVKIDAIAVDDAGKSYSFTGSTYMRLDTRRGGLHAFPITRRWKEVSNGVDAAFSHGEDLYLIKDDHVYIYKTAGEDTLIEGYPKTLLEELSIEGHVDAAFVCPTEHIVHVIQGNMIRYVNLIATPRNVTDYPLPLSGIDAALCNAEGIQLFKGSQYYKYATPMILSMSRIAPHPLPITNAVLGCQDE